MSFSEQHEGALADLATVWADVPFVVIGAAALAHHLPGSSYRWMTTADLDLAVAIELDEHPKGLDEREGWAPLSKHGGQTWVSPLGVRVDLLPSGPGLRSGGILRWPETGAEMNLAAFDLAYDHNVAVPLSDGQVVRVATVPAVAVLKMVAYLDRPDARERDLQDLAVLLDEYVKPDDARRFDDDVYAAGLDFDESGPFVLGREVGAVCRPSHRELIAEFLGMLASEDAPTHIRMRRRVRAWWRSDPRELTKRLVAFRLGISR